MIAIRYKKLASGKFSIYFDHYNEVTKKRHYEFLKLYVTRDYSKGQKILGEDRPAMQTAHLLVNERNQSIVPAPPLQIQQGNISLVAFVESLSQNEPSTYLRPLRTHLIKFIGKGKSPELRKTNADWIATFVEYISTEVSQQYSRTILRILTTAFNKAIQKGLISTNPASTVVKPTLSYPETARLSKEETNLLLQTPSLPNLQIGDAFLFSLHTGLGWQHIKNLQWEHVSSSLKDNTTQYTLTIIDPKKTYTIELDSDAAEILDNYSGTKKGKVFDKLPQETAYTRKLVLWGYQSGLKRSINFSMARFTFLDNMIHKGKPIKEICRELGIHENSGRAMHLWRQQKPQTRQKQPKPRY